jgi:hypothetical protein
MIQKKNYVPTVDKLNLSRQVHSCFFESESISSTLIASEFRSQSRIFPALMCPGC